MHWCVAYNWSYGRFVIFLAYFGQNVVAMATSLRPLQSQMFSLNWWATKTPVISNHILVISRRNAFICFIAIIVPKLVAMVTAVCPLCTGVSQVNSLIVQTLSQNQTLHWHVAYNWSYGHFVIFWLIFAKIWLPWQRPLDPCNQNCLIWIDWPLKPYPRTNNLSIAVIQAKLYRFVGSRQV